MRSADGATCTEVFSGNSKRRKNLSDVCERLDKGLLNFAIVMSYVDLSKYNYMELPMKDTWGILMRKDDPLAGKNSFAASDLDKLVNTGEESDLTFIPLSGVPQTQMYVIWRKYQTFTPIANLLLQELKTRLC